MMTLAKPLLRSYCLLLLFLLSFAARAAEIESLRQLDVKRGIVALIDLPADGPRPLLELLQSSEFTVFFQSADGQQVEAVRQMADLAGLLGSRIFVDSGPTSAIHLADNVADAVWVSPTAREAVQDQELLRVLRPRAVALIGDRRLVKPVPEGIDEWTHPYHGPDNNPQSQDKLLRGNLHTQFLASPTFSPMPEQSVSAGGRIFKAMGHIAHKENQNEWLNTLLCINAYNGTILWRRALPDGFMIHRNTMIATDDVLLMGDAQSCKVIDAATGQDRDEITVPAELTDGPVWKWMALRDGVLYALVGNPEIHVDTQKSARRGLGHWPWDMWQGHDYADPRTSFGFGRTLVAIDLASKKILWHHRDKEFIDARGMCMNGERIFCYSPERFLLCLDAADGMELWKKSDPDLLAAIGPNGKAQHYVTGYATTCYVKCNDDFVFFAGPQRTTLAVASARYGTLAWTYPHGNLQLVLRDDGVYAAGPEATGVRLDYATGRLLDELPTRRACTRATGGADSVFYRTSGGTVRVRTDKQTAEHIAPMRPPCQDGVMIANGQAYWGPWMCGCQLSLYGHIALAPAGDEAAEEGQAARWTGQRLTDVKPLGAQPHDWTTYRGNNARTDEGATPIPADVTLAWQVDVSGDQLPTAPVSAGGLIFVADRGGRVRAFDLQGRQVWKAYTPAAIYYPPAIAQDRLFVGSADGRVHAFEAATGRPLWTYRVAPRDEWIPVYGKLINRWPVAGGVVVRDGTVYAAAGIAHYDGTHVVALDAASGEPKAENRTSGMLSEQVNGGISMQGELTIVGDELQFLGGGVYETARYDLKTLECLNAPKAQVTSQFRTAFYPLYPDYGKYLSLDYTRPDRTSLVHDASYEGSQFTNLALKSALPPGVPQDKQEAARWERRRGAVERKVLWQDAKDRRFTSFIVSDPILLVAGHAEGAEPFLAAMTMDDGTDRWYQTLPALAVKGGTAIDPQGRIFVTLENGQLLCFVPKAS
jgi:outer membrane protein assembly factor BamB